MNRLSPRAGFFIALATTLAFRLWLSAAAPFTVDEAYFALWGRHPDLGFYDHPPMIGWWLAPLLALSDAEWVARLPATLAPAAVALAVRAALRGWFARDAQTADLTGIAVLLVPINLWNVLVTTDAPLLVFSVAAALVFARGVQRGSAGLELLAGVLLGLAFLSKYFAVLLGLAMLAWAVQARRWRAAGLLAAGALPAGLLNLVWNLNACWSNVLFNAINRHDDAGWSLVTPSLYIASLAYLAAPFLWLLWRERARAAAALASPETRVIAWAWVVPLVVFALLTPFKRIGLHWLQSFIPMLLLTAAVLLPREALVRGVRFFAVFAVLHAGVAFAVAALPLATWQGTRFQSTIVFHARTPLILAALAPDLERRALAADGYAAAAVLAWHGRRDVPVFGGGSSHARHDDILTDWRALAGRDLLIFRRSAPPVGTYDPFFRQVEIDTLRIAGATYYAIRGDGFDYATYRDRVLVPVRERYYRIPAVLPVARCYFFERYFSQ